MTHRLTVSVPDDVAAWLEGYTNASAAVTDAVRLAMTDQETRRAKRRADAAAYAEWEREYGKTYGLDELDAQTFEISMRGAEW